MIQNRRFENNIHSQVIPLSKFLFSCSSAPHQDLEQGWDNDCTSENSK